MTTARRPGESIRGKRIVYFAGGVHPKTREGRAFVKLDKDVDAIVVRRMNLQAGVRGVPIEEMSCREAEGRADRHQALHGKRSIGAHRRFEGYLDGDAVVTVTVATGPRR